jgi:hypothetical protein
MPMASPRDAGLHPLRRCSNTWQIRESPRTVTCKRPLRMVVTDNHGWLLCDHCDREPGWKPDAERTSA